MATKVHEWRCCEADLTSPFCPECGAAYTDPAVSLLNYLRQQASLLERELEKTRADRAGEIHIKHVAEHVDYMKRNAEKWRAWANYVDDCVCCAAC